MEERCCGQRVQQDRRYRTGLWGVWHHTENRYIAYGPQGKIQQLVKLLNDEQITERISK